jgi:NAD(P)-dependent dehydrogenase (short-subunit alcohol dehydrogenase family)
MDRAGWRVFAGIRRLEDGERLRGRASPSLAPIALDVTSGESIASALAHMSSALHDAGLDGLVNNAGIAVAGPLEVLPLEDLRRQLEVNVVGQVAVTQAFLPLLRRSSGRIVLMGSVGGRLSMPFLAPYCMSKFALEAIADALRLELAPWGIAVSLIEPGAIATPIWNKSVEAAGTMYSKLEPRAGADYEAALERVGAAAQESGRKGVPASRVADVVQHALTATAPRTRYLVGRDARLRALLARLVPDRERDRLISRALKLPRRG